MIDPQTILSDLGFPEATAITQVSGGRDAAIWRVESRNETCALRVFSPHRMQGCLNEAAAMRAAADAGIPVPPVYAVERRDTYAAMLIGWCEGRTVVEEFRARPWRVYHLGRMSGEMLALINRVRVADGTLPKVRDRDGATRPSPRLSDIWVDGALVHLDFHPLNTLTDGQRITAVLDWANARVGDPRADLARSITILRLDSGQLSLPARLLVRVFEHGLRRGYGPVRDLAPFLAWAGEYMRDDLSSRNDDSRSSQRQQQRIRQWIGRYRGDSS